MENKYRYPGTRPFQEKDSHLFFGRKSDKIKLTELIVLEKLVVLFGKSGYGKTSLLNAAVIPRLRRFEKHRIYNIRLLEAQSPNTVKRSPLSVLLEQLKNDSGGNSFLADKLNIPALLPDDITAQIWYYSKLIQFKNKHRKAITLIFDQFEELNQFEAKHLDDFGRCMAKLLNLNAPKSVRRLIEKKLDTDEAYFNRNQVHDLLKPLNLKVVLSLHHDRLSLLDRLKQYLPTIFKYTYELKPLTEKQARNAFLKPAALSGDFSSPEFTYTEGATNAVFKYLKDKNQLIEPFQLQLLGQHAEERILIKKKNTERKEKLTKQNKDQGKAKYELGIKDLGKPDAIFKKHYQKVISSLAFVKQSRVRKLVEKVLIIKERRVPMPEVVITSQHNVGKKTLDDLIDKRLLRSELNTVQDTSYEVSHDTLVKPILESAERRKRKRLWLLVIGLFLAIIAGLLGWIYSLENSTGEDREVSNGLIINAIATATALPTTGPAPLEVSFIFNETYNIDSIRVTETSWDFGDGTPEIKADSLALKHIYKEEGTYLARLIVKDNYGRTRIDNIEIIVLPPDTTLQKPPVVQILAEPATGNEPLNVNFSTRLDGITASKFLWEYEDPFPSTAPNPSHRFERAGEYMVRLSVWDVQNALGQPFMDSVKITVGQLGPFTSEPPVARAKTFVPNGNQNVFTHGFTAEESTDDVAIVRYLWEFQDSTIATAKKTPHTFDNAGIYKVRLTVWDEEDQSDMTSLSIFIDNDTTPPTPIPQPITANAGASVTNGIAPLEVTFTGGIVGDDGSEVTYEWDFKDGSNISTLQNPAHIFNDAGVYPVLLTIKGNQTFGADTIEITVDPLPPIPPMAIAEMSVAKGKLPLEVQFKGSNSTPTDSIRNYFWDFNDAGESSDLADPSHSFEKIGNYEVYLTVTDGAGLTDKDTVIISVVEDEPPIAVITPSTASGSIPFDVILDGGNSQDDGDIVSYKWFLGDSLITNETETKASITHKFVDIGTHDVRLQVTDEKGQSASAKIQITAIDRIPKKPAAVEALTWMQRFIGIQQLHLPIEFEGNNAWKNWSIIPDSLNIMGVLIPDSLIDHDISESRKPALLFFFTNDGRGDVGRKVYKFRNEIKNSEIKNLLRSERFSLNGLIRQAKRNTGNTNSGIIRKFIAPNQATVRLDTSEIKNMARLLEKNKINDKTLNVYYALFPMSHFKASVQDTIIDIYTRLTPLQGQE